MTDFRYGKFVIWGLSKGPLIDLYWNWSHFYKAAQYLNIPVIWVEDIPESNDLIDANDLVLIAPATTRPDSRNDHRYIPGATYVTFNVLDSLNPWAYDIPPEDRLLLSVNCAQEFPGNYHTYICPLTSAEDALKREYWDVTTIFDREARCLFQPWGTDLEPNQFLTPVAPHGDVCYWIGSIWNDELNQGNEAEIAVMVESLKQHGIGFANPRQVPQEDSALLVRESRLAPSIAGLRAVEHNCLPCRTFKNTSYGQLAITNVPYFKKVFDGCSLQSETIPELIDEAMSLDADTYVEMTYAQQACIHNQGYATKIKNILRALEEIR